MEMDQCTLVLQVEHMYEAEGTYRIEVTAFNDVSEAPGTLLQDVTIERELKQPSISSKRVLPVNATLNFTVSFLSRSANMHCQWMLWRQLLTEEKPASGELHPQNSPC